MTDNKEFAKQMRENAVKNEQGNIVCSTEWLDDLFKQIIRLQAENERLKSKLEPQGFEEADPMDFCGVLCDFAEGLIEKAKSEAYKEFAERVKLLNQNNLILWNEQIDNLLKELVGEDKVQWSKQGECPITPEQFEAIYNDEVGEDG